MMNIKTVPILAHLEIGFRTDSARLKELEKNCTETLQSARHLGRKHGSPDDWNMNWDQQWDNVEGILRRIRALLYEMDDTIENSDSVRLEKVSEVWETFQTEDARLLKAFSDIRAQASGLNAVVRKDWNILARTMESHLETIHARAQALRIKLELLKKHSNEEVDHLVQTILSKLPNRPHAEEMDAETCEQEYRKAAIELQQEQHEYLGFMEVVKALMLWVETTEERVIKNLSLQVDEGMNLADPQPSLRHSRPTLL